MGWRGITVVVGLMGTGLAASLWWAVPGEGTNSAVERGRGLYALHCAACHGADGEGRARGNATSLNNPDFLAAAGDAFLRATIARGRCGTEMRAWAQAAGGPLRPAEIEEVIAFLRSWQRDVPQRPAPRAGRGDPTHGRKVYEAACASCHGWEGKGELGMGPALSNPDFLATADDAFLWATVAYGRRDTPMFPSLRGLDGVRQFSEAEIDDLVAYLRSWQGGTPDEHDSALE